MRIAATGFVSVDSGSIASANALLLAGLLDAGVEVDFFSKPSFVDPRDAVGERAGFRFWEVINVIPDRLRASVESVPVVGGVACHWDAATYNRLLVERMSHAQSEQAYDAVLWMGDYAQGRIRGVPSVSFVQGPPGSDARSIISRRAEIRRLAGARQWLKWCVLAKLRLSRFGHPRFQHSDHFIVGSSWSAGELSRRYSVATSRISTLPYPMDLQRFGGSALRRRYTGTTPLRALWLGRIVPRKRLDLFLDGAELAIREGLNLHITIVGRVGFIAGYEKLIQRFPYPDRIDWQPSLAREKVPKLLADHHVLVQPSEDEDFGSSVAEAQAMGLPVIVGQSNGTSDYICRRSTRLLDYQPSTLCRSLRRYGENLHREDESAWLISRRVASVYYDVNDCVRQLKAIINEVIQRAKMQKVSEAV